MSSNDINNEAVGVRVTRATRRRLVDNESKSVSPEDVNPSTPKRRVLRRNSSTENSNSIISTTNIITPSKRMTRRSSLTDEANSSVSSPGPRTRRNSVFLEDNLVTPAAIIQNRNKNPLKIKETLFEEEEEHNKEINSINDKLQKNLIPPIKEEGLNTSTPILIHDDDSESEPEYKEAKDRNKILFKEKQQNSVKHLFERNNSKMKVQRVTRSSSKSPSFGSVCIGRTKSLSSKGQEEIIDNSLDAIKNVKELKSNNFEKEDGISNETPAKCETEKSVAFENILNETPTTITFPKTPFLSKSKSFVKNSSGEIRQTYLSHSMNAFDKNEIGNQEKFDTSNVIFSTNTPIKQMKSKTNLITSSTPILFSNLELTEEINSENKRENNLSKNDKKLSEDVENSFGKEVNDKIPKDKSCSNVDFLFDVSVQNSEKSSPELNKTIDIVKKNNSENKDVNNRIDENKENKLSTSCFSSVKENISKETVHVNDSNEMKSKTKEVSITKGLKETSINKNEKSINKTCNSSINTDKNFKEKEAPAMNESFEIDNNVNNSYTSVTKSLKETSINKNEKSINKTCNSSINTDKNFKEKEAPAMNESFVIDNFENNSYTSITKSLKETSINKNEKSINKTCNSSINTDKNFKEKEPPTMNESFEIDNNVNNSYTSVTKSLKETSINKNEKSINKTCISSINTDKNFKEKEPPTMNESFVIDSYANNSYTSSEQNSSNLDSSKDTLEKVNDENLSQLNQLENNNSKLNDSCKEDMISIDYSKSLLNQNNLIDNTSSGKDNLQKIKDNSKINMSEVVVRTKRLNKKFLKEFFNITTPILNQFPKETNELGKCSKSDDELLFSSFSDNIEIETEKYLKEQHNHNKSNENESEKIHVIKNKTPEENEKSEITKSDIDMSTESLKENVDTCAEIVKENHDEKTINDNSFQTNDNIIKSKSQKNINEEMVDMIAVSSSTQKKLDEDNQKQNNQCQVIDELNTTIENDTLSSGLKENCKNNILESIKTGNKSSKHDINYIISRCDEFLAVNEENKKQARLQNPSQKKSKKSKKKPKVEINNDEKPKKYDINFEEDKKDVVKAVKHSATLLKESIDKNVALLQKSQSNKNWFEKESKERKLPDEVICAIDSSDEINSFDEEEIDDKINTKKFKKRSLEELFSDSGSDSNDNNYIDLKPQNENQIKKKNKISKKNNNVKESSLDEDIKNSFDSCKQTKKTLKRQENDQRFEDHTKNSFLFNKKSEKISKKQKTDSESSSYEKRGKQFNKRDKDENSFNINLDDGTKKLLVSKKISLKKSKEQEKNPEIYSNIKIEDKIKNPFGAYKKTDKAFKKREQDQEISSNICLKDETKSSFVSSKTSERKSKKQEKNPEVCSNINIEDKIKNPFGAYKKTDKTFKKREQDQEISSNISLKDETKSFFISNKTSEKKPKKQEKNLEKSTKVSFEGKNKNPFKKPEKTSREHEIDQESSFTTKKSKLKLNLDSALQEDTIVEKQNSIKNENGFIETQLKPKISSFQAFDMCQNKIPLPLKKKNKRKREIIEEPQTLLPKPVWTSSGEFSIEEHTSIKKVKLSLPTTNSTNFIVTPLEKKSKNKEMSSLCTSALNFKSSSMFNSKIKRETSKELLQRIKRQQLNKF